MSRIIIEADKLKDPFSGLGNFAHHLISELLNQNQDFDFRVYSSKPGEFAFIGLEESHAHRLFSNMLPKGDLWHILHQDSSYIPTHSKFLLTIQDMNYFYKDKSKILKAKYRLSLASKIKRASGLTFISDFARKETEKYFDISKKKIKVIHNGVEKPKKIETPEYKPERPFLFTVSKLLPKKNIHVLFDFLKHLNDEILLIAGGLDTPYAKELQKTVSEKRLEEKVIFLGPVNSGSKFWYMKNCKAFMFPSLFEGFGLPPLEAMHFGKPVFVSRSTSIPEVCEDKAYYFENFRPEDMVLNYRKALESFSEIRSQEIMDHSAKFTWERAVREYLKFYQEILFHS